MIDTVAIKDKVLHLALRGGLVRQDFSDEPADILVSHISEKLNGRKFTQDFDESEIPFNIPKNWIWCRLSDIGNTNIGLTYHPEDIVDAGTIVIRSSNIVNGKMDYTDLVKVDCPIRESQYLENNDIVICARNGSKALVGKCAVYEGSSREAAFGAFMAVFRTQFYKYVYYYFQTSVFRRYFSNDDTKQINQVTQDILKRALIPFPPVEEQKRITDMVEQIASILESIDNLQTRYQADTAVLTRKLIDAGIRGKLTEQLPEDGTAEEFYARILCEKERIQKQKSKKEQDVMEISSEEIPFEIPHNWKWVRLGNLMKNRDSERIPVSVEDRRKLQKKYDYYGASGVIDKVESYLFEGKLLLVGEDGANLLSRNTPVAFIANGKYWVNNHAHVLGYYVEDYLDYVMYYINSISLVPYVTGAAQPKLNQDNMNRIPIPLPPMPEMRRIVDKINAVLGVV